MKAKYLLWLSVVFVPTCGFISGSSPLFGGDSDLLGLAGKIVGKARERIPECEALGDPAKIVGDDQNPGTLSFQEERGLGGGALVAYLVKFGGLRIDTPKELRGVSMEQLKVKLNDNNEDESAKVVFPQTSDNRLHKNIATIGWHLADLSKRPSIPWTFCVIKNPGINAYSTPGGYVCVTEGLLDSVDNEAELACVLAHEIGHVVEKHGLLEYGKIKQSQCLTMLASDVAGDLVKVDVKFGDYFDLNHASKELVQKLVDSFVEKMINIGFGKESEFKADAYMYDLVSQAGYNRSACQAFLNRLPSSGSVFANHPAPAERVQKLAEIDLENKDSFGYQLAGKAPHWSLESARSK